MSGHEAEAAEGGQVAVYEPMSVPVQLGAGRRVEPPRGTRPRVLIVNPLTPINFWSFSEAGDITNDRGNAMPNLALPTLAALTPDDFDITLVDENVDKVDYEVPWDIVGITGYISQQERMKELAAEFRERGRLVLIGGPFASLSSSTMRPHADVLFVGEAEHSWPQFLSDYRSGWVQAEYSAGGTIDMADSPTPRLDLLNNSQYGMGVLQTSRGCPHACEFCDVIILLDRNQRHKSTQQIVAELDHLYAEGYRRVFLSDDNFTANARKAREIMVAVRDWNAAQEEPTSFHTQLSIDVARERNTDLIDLCIEARLDLAFIGIETPDEGALLSVKKRQNTHRDLLESVQFLQERGMQVMAGMIAGFDSDTVDSFDRQFEFLQRAGIPMVSLSVLNAPEGTPLEARLLEANRIKGFTKDLYFSTNLVPLSMTSEELAIGTQWLMNRLYHPAAFLERVRVLTERLPERPVLRHASSPKESLSLWRDVRNSYDALGPAYAHIPPVVAKAFRGRSPEQAMWILTFYRHVVGLCEAWGFWDQRLVDCTTVTEAAEVLGRPIDSNKGARHNEPVPHPG